jgi:glycosyltransferase involved in cell wall biosynthesis
MDASGPDLSLVIPIWKGEAFVRDRLAFLCRFLEQSGLTYEILPVDDGSPDRTAEVLNGLGMQGVRPITDVPDLGKFGAIREGMKRTAGRCASSRTPTSPTISPRFPTWCRWCATAGSISRSGTAPSKVRRTPKPSGFLAASRQSLFAVAIRLIVTGGLFDTQCGLKAFRGDVARALFPVLREDGFAGDVEALYVALKYNLEIKRIPVRLRHHGPSSVSTLKHGFTMLRSIFPLKGRWDRGMYRSPDLERLAAQDYRVLERLIRASARRAGTRSASRGSGTLN